MALNSKHLFSLYTELDLCGVDQHSDLMIDRFDEYHRIVHVLRFKPEDIFVLFNQKIHLFVQLQHIEKKRLFVKILQKEHNQILNPSVSFLLPLLKKDALEQAVYELVEIGINNISLTITEKSRQSLQSEKEFARLHNIMIAAAEQSKNYSISFLQPPEKLFNLLKMVQAERKFVFDADGLSLKKILLEDDFSIKEKVLLVGPEGGLTNQELDLVQNSGFRSVALTSTTLRAVQAVALAAGVCRLK